MLDPNLHSRADIPGTVAASRVYGPVSSATVSAVLVVDAGPRRVVRRVLVTASAAEIFALVVDPHRHPELDGSGTVRDIPITGPHHLAVGDEFTVGMRHHGSHRDVRLQHPQGAPAARVLRHAHA